jgi:hypothetical protein
MWCNKPIIPGVDIYIKLFHADVRGDGYSKGLIFHFSGVSGKGERVLFGARYLGAQFILVYVIEHLEITGGTNGMTCPFASIGPWVLDTPAKIYWLTMAVTGVMIFFTHAATSWLVGPAGLSKFITP